VQEFDVPLDVRQQRRVASLVTYVLAGPVQGFMQLVAVLQG